MQEILDQLFSPVWCFSVVIVGIVVGVIANRSDRLLDRLFGGVSTRWSKRTEKARANYLATITTLRESEKARQIQQVRILRRGFLGLASLVSALFLTVVSAVGPAIPEIFPKLFPSSLDPPVQKFNSILALVFLGIGMFLVLSTNSMLQDLLTALYENDNEPSEEP